MEENKINSGAASQKPAAANIIMLSVFMIFIFGFAAALLIVKDREFSEMENRELAQKPEFTLKNLTEGKFTADLESYISDQMFLKDALVSLKTDCDRAMGKNYQNGVFFSKDGYLLQQYIENKKQLDDNISYINGFAQKLDVPIDFILVPNAVSELADKLPVGAYNDSQSESIDYISSALSERITLCDLRETMKNPDYYYKTDHHWTSEGAKAAMEYYFESTGQTKLSVDYDVETIESFYGTLYSKAPSSQIKPDEMHLYINPNGEYSVEYVKENKLSDTIYNRSFIDKKDKYSTFFGGNFSQIKIKTNCTSGKKVLILKDSYANSMIPFLADQYSEITMVDMRYYHFEENTVSELAKLCGADRVIMIYNMDFVNSDNNFIWLE